jgi:hypothetical protein
VAVLPAIVVVPVSMQVVGVALPLQIMMLQTTKKGNILPGVETVPVVEVVQIRIKVLEIHVAGCMLIQIGIHNTVASL